jgi:hypothetical protein
VTDELLPMWAVYPDIRYPSMGWNMGPGEDYKQKFWTWFNTLTDEQAGDYARRYPEPENWLGKYAQIRKDRDNG